MTENDNCHVEPIEKAIDQTALQMAQAAFLSVSGMGCPRCATRVRNGLLTLDGVLVAEVRLENGIAAAAYDPKRVTPDILAQAVASAGNDGKHHYRAEVLKILPADEALRW
jgi:copper chaperone CopZ